MHKYQLKIRVLYSDQHLTGGEIVEEFSAKDDLTATNTVKDILLPLLKERFKRDTSIACVDTKWNLVKLVDPVLVESGLMN